MHSERSESPLCAAIKKASVAELRTLLAKDAAALAKPEPYLHLCVVRGDPAIAELLIHYGLDPKQSDRFLCHADTHLKGNALALAIGQRNIPMIVTLLRAGVSTGQPEYNGGHYGCFSNKPPKDNKATFQNHLEKLVRDEDCYQWIVNLTGSFHDLPAPFQNLGTEAAVGLLTESFVAYRWNKVDPKPLAPYYPAIRDNLEKEQRAKKLAPFLQVLATEFLRYKAANHNSHHREASR